MHQSKGNRQKKSNESPILFLMLLLSPYQAHAAPVGFTLTLYAKN